MEKKKIRIDIKVYNKMMSSEFPIWMPPHMIVENHVPPGIHTPEFNMTDEEYEEFATWANTQSDMKILGAHDL
jgi:hypothetical protein